MDIDRLYVPTILQTRINLKCHELNGKGTIGDKLERTLQQRYSGKCIEEGYIKPGSIKLEKKQVGLVRSAHFTGQPTYKVSYKALVYIPTYGSIVKARVRNNNKAGMIAVAEPLQIIVARQGHFNTDPRIFDQYRIGDIVNIQLLTFRLESEYIFAVGKLESLVIETDKTYALPGINGMDLSNLQIHLRSTNKVPALNTEAFGNPQPLNEKKSEIDEYNVKPDRIWERFIRYFINPYELLANRAYNRETVIKFQNSWNRDSLSWVPTGNSTGLSYEPFSRAYYKLREILFDFPPPGNQKGQASLLDNWRKESIRVLHLAEGPGGFVHCTLDTRGTSAQAMEDYYFAITLKKPNSESPVKDWNFPPAKAYFKNVQTQRGEDNFQTVYGPSEDSNGDLTDPEIIQYVIRQFNGKVNEIDEEDDAVDGDADQDLGAHFITADGAIDVSDDYNIQEIKSYKLFYSEILLALACQRVGGCFILKIYDIYTDVTCQLLVILQFFYESVYITKPNTSRPANSEKYVVCQEFKGFSENRPKEVFIAELMRGLEEWNNLEADQTEQIAAGQNPETFITSIIDTIIPSELQDIIRLNNEKFIERQIKKIDEGIELVKSKKITKPAVQINIKTNQKPIAFQWCQDYLGEMSCNTAIQLDTKNINLGEKKKVGKIVLKKPIEK